MSQNPGIGSSATISGVVSTKTALTPSAPTTATVGVASALAVAANANRKGLAIVNTSANVVSLAFGANPAVLNSGITLTTTGSVYEMSEYDYSLLAVNAIASGSGSVISIQEWQ